MTDTLADLTSALNTYVVSPLNAFGLGGFVFDVQGEDHSSLTADITDHYTEDNKALQDHIAIRPKRVTLKGYVGELVYAPTSGTLGVLQTVTQKLTILSAYLPQVSAAVTQAQAAISGINSAGDTLQSLAAEIPAAANIYGLVQNAIGAFGSQAKQEGAYQYFAACMTSGVLMGIQTPWEFLTNMAIESIEAIQSEDSIFVTDFSITYKQIRIANSQSVAVSALAGTGGTPPAPGQTFQQPVAALQGQSTTNLGSIPGTSIVALPPALNNPLAGVFQYVAN